jgi:threonylcarbamoyladenosine tRNA methylthiotransferase MtaB
VDAATRRRRAGELAEIAGRLRQGILEAQVGARVPVLREEAPGSGNPRDLFGYTPNYLPIRIEPDPAAPPVGEILETRILGTTPDGALLLGRRISAA